MGSMSDPNCVILGVASSSTGGIAFQRFMATAVVLSWEDHRLVRRIP